MGVTLDLDPRAFRQALGQFATGISAERASDFRGTYRSVASNERSPEWPLPMRY